MKVRLSTRHATLFWWLLDTTMPSLAVIVTAWRVTYKSGNHSAMHMHLFGDRHVEHPYAHAQRAFLINGAYPGSWHFVEDMFARTAARGHRYKPGAHSILSFLSHDLKTRTPNVHNVECRESAELSERGLICVQQVMQDTMDVAKEVQQYTDPFKEFHEKTAAKCYAFAQASKPLVEKIMNNADSELQTLKVVAKNAVREQKGAAESGYIDDILAMQRSINQFNLPRPPEEHIVTPSDLSQGKPYAYAKYMFWMHHASLVDSRILHGINEWTEKSPRDPCSIYAGSMHIRTVLTELGRHPSFLIQRLALPASDGAIDLSSLPRTEYQ